MKSSITSATFDWPTKWSLSRDFLHQISKELYRSVSLHEKLYILKEID